MSQRHRIVEYGAASNGEAHAEGVVAPGLMMQVDPENIGVLKPKAGEPDVVVPIGEYGGPLSGSSLTGAIPEDFVPPEPEPPDPNEDFRIVVINPNEIPAGMPDMTATVNGVGFEDGAVVVFDGNDMATDFLSDNQLRFIVPSGAAVAGTVLVTVRNPGGEVTEESTFTFAAAAVQVSRQATGPINIVSIRRDEGSDKLVITIDDASAILPGTVITIEASGSSSVNGQYTVEAAEGGEIVIDSDYPLDKPIEGKGRVLLGG